MIKEYQIISKLKETYGEMGELKVLSDNKEAYKKAINNIKIACPGISKIIMESVFLEKHNIGASISFNQNLCTFKIAKIEGKNVAKQETVFINNYKNYNLKEIEDFFKKTLFKNIPSHNFENTSPPVFH